MDIGKIDKNFAIEKIVVEDDIVYYDVRQNPFRIYGLYNPLEDGGFKRIPEYIAKNTSEGVYSLYRNTAGGRVRFSTNATVIYLRCKLSRISKMTHMPLVSSAGFDLYIDNPEDGTSRFYNVARPAMDIQDGFEAKFSFKSSQKRYITINFPSYSNLDKLELGFPKDAEIGEGLTYRDMDPIIYYGSSITQGGCSSRPGTSYQNMICRQNNIDYVNLGFSGNGRGEEIICDYMANLKMSAFVSDYDHNSSVDNLAKTHMYLYRAIRKTYPDIPYVIVSRPDFMSGYEDSIRRRNYCYETYMTAISEGDKNVYFVDGSSLFRGTYEDCCTVDGTHPNDLGFMYMADKIGSELKWAFERHKHC